VPVALGKGKIALGKEAPSKPFVVKPALPSAVLSLGKDLTPSADGSRRFGLYIYIFFAECNTRQRIFDF
jgi:hypothetical protein